MASAILATRLAELTTLDAALTSSLVADVTALFAASQAGTKPLHDLLKQKHGVKTIGTRQQIVLAVNEAREKAAAAPPEDAPTAAFRAALASRGLEAHADALVPQARRLAELASSSQRDFHDQLRASGVKALGMRQQVLIALQPLLPKPLHKPKPRSAASSAPVPAKPQAAAAADDDGDDELMLEENPADGGRKGGAADGDDDDDDGLALEDNAAAAGGDDDGDDDDDGGLALEENDDDAAPVGSGGGAGDDSDSDGLALEENPTESGHSKPSARAADGSDDSDEGFLLIEPNDFEGGSTAAGSSPVGKAKAKATGGAAGQQASTQLEYVGNMKMELTPPPSLPHVQPVGKTKPEDPVEGALIAGVMGSQALKRSLVMSELLQLRGIVVPKKGDNRPVDKMRVQQMLDLCSKLYLGFTSKMLVDLQWRGTHERLAKAVGKPHTPSALPLGGYTGAALGSSMLSSLSLETMLESTETREQRVCVLGLGSAVPALVAAKAGATVVWAEQIERLANIAEKLASRNGLAKKVHVLRGETFESMDWEHADQPGAEKTGTSETVSAALRAAGIQASGETFDPSAAPVAGDYKFDSVITEEHSDDLLSDGIVGLAHLAKRTLLRPGGVFYPKAAMVYCALASIRTTTVQGQKCVFDSRLFNVFRNTQVEVVYDLEEVYLNEPGCGALLSRPVPIWGIDFNDPPSIAALDSAMSERFSLRATSDGIYNCIVTWHELDMGDETGTLSFAPNSRSPRHMYGRGVKQRLFFTGYEQRLEMHDLVQVELHKSASTYRVTPVADDAASRAGTLVRWPTANVLSYHFPMIAEAPRNVKFERALLRSIRAYQRAHGGEGPHVLDIGSGTGLLAMMAARAGARKVTSVEMVPAIASVAAQIVERNGYGDVIDIINIRSDELSLYSMGGERADICVSELIDDHVIGDGVLSSIADAKKRLLTPEAMIVPRAGRMQLVPVCLRARGPPGIELDEMNEPLTDQVILSFPYHSAKIQRLPASEYEVLGPPVEIFDFDWANANDVEELGGGRTCKPVSLTFTRGGVCNALLLTFTLQMDADPKLPHLDARAEGGEPIDLEGIDSDYSSGVDNPETHWDQPARFLPIELHVSQGDKLQVTARHSLHDLEQINLYGVTDRMLNGALGHFEFLDSGLGTKLQVVLSQRRAPAS